MTNAVDSKIAEQANTQANTIETKTDTGNEPNHSVDVTATVASSVIEKPTKLDASFALIKGQPMTQLPMDLYIPPDALEIILEQFEGPLDLLLYLIRKQNLDILEVNVADITTQYMGYIDMMHLLHLEMAGEYLVMAAMLAEIKSRMLLPRNKDVEDEDEEDPRAELIRRLQEYERFKKAAEDIEELPRMERDNFSAKIDAPERIQERVHPDVDIKELMLAMGSIMRRAQMFEKHEVARETLSTRERMSNILFQLKGGHFVSFVDFFTPEEGRLGVVVTFLAILELIKESLLDIVQHDVLGPIHVKARMDGPGHIDSILKDGSFTSEFDSPTHSEVDS